MFWDSYDKADNAQLWNPSTGAFTPAAKAGYNIFCTGFSFLANGHLLVTGGHIADFEGLRTTSDYNPFTNSWTMRPNMNAGRWYPTNTTLSNGDVLVVSGQIDNTQGMDPLPQVWQVATGTWRSLTGAQLVLPFYPYMYQAPNGKVFAAGPNQTARYLNTSGAGAWTVVGDNRDGTRTWGSSVMYEPGKVLILGGTSCGPYDNGCTAFPTNTAETIDLTAAVPAWNEVGPRMANARKHANATMLPDGKVLVTGGTQGNEPTTSDSTNPANAAEIWDPQTGNWTKMASASVYRGYHAVALLLPDGRVFSGGGNFTTSYEVFSPPYLFKGARPTITSAPPAVAYGQSFTVKTPDAASITAANLVGLSTVTHTFNAGQRFNHLTFTKSTDGSGLVVTAPPDGNFCPPGYYMLFILNSNGVPSVAQFIRIDTVVPNTPPTVSITSPANGATFTAPATITINATAADSDGTVSKVDFYQGATLLGTDTTAPYSFTWSNVAVGSYSLTARATDNAGATTTSAPVAITVKAVTSGPTATFVKADSTTQGSWKGVYGADGYNVINDVVSYPAYAQVTPNGNLAYTWVPSTTDIRALQTVANSANRIAATWYSATTFTIDVNLTDGATHRVALYCLDWDSGGARAQQIDVLDAAQNVVLDTRTISGFTNGQYLVWDVKGQIRFRFTRTGGNNAVVSGLFFGTPSANTAPTVSITAPTNGATFTAPATITINATAADSDGTVSKVDFYQGTTLLGTDTAAPYSFTWSNVAAGSYSLTARATDNAGATTTSAAVNITVNANTSPAVSFVKTDTTTQGSWKGVYGADGYNVINDAVSYPAYAQVTPTGNLAYTWMASTTDVRALQTAASSTNRIAATWYSTTSFTLDVSLTDGATHRVALYCLDWDALGARAQQIDVLDPVQNVVLDTRTISGFANGQYLVWDVKGQVRFRFTRTSGSNAVLSGLFFSPPLATGPSASATTGPAADTLHLTRAVTMGEKGGT